MKDNQKDQEYILYTDGACTGNPGPGGRGVVVIQNGDRRDAITARPQSSQKPICLSGKSAHTTNNKMELTAVIKGLERICEQNSIVRSNSGKGFKNLDFNAEDRLTSTARPIVVIYTDSQYVKNGMQEWIQNWKHNGWKTSGRKPVANKELRQELDVLVGLFDIQRHWVKGHNGNKYNEMADRLATA